VGRDNSGIYFTVQSEGSQNLHFVSVAGQSKKITDGKHVLAVSDIHANGTAVGTLTGPLDPADVIAFDVKRPSEIRALTDVNGDILYGKKLGAVEEIWYTSVDNLRIQGWIVKPPDFDATKKYPLMLTIHGGPHSMYNVGFNFGYGARRQRLRGALHQPARLFGLRQRFRERDQERVSRQGLRRSDEGRRRGDQEGLRR
jgi:dipeptidyl aminopeptidase/acylaminoacyl peptidase